MLDTEAAVHAGRTIFASAPPVLIDVGGTRFKTTADTLTRGTSPL